MLIGDTIEKASFIIEFPKNIDKDEVYVYLGGQYEDASGSQDVYFEVGKRHHKRLHTSSYDGGEKTSRYVFRWKKVIFLQ